jgi:hypothetical protein
MNDADRQRALEKKKLLQAQLAVAEQSKQLVNWWLPAIHVLETEQTGWTLQYLTYAEGDQYRLWLQELRRQPWHAFSFSDAVILNRDDSFIHDRIFTDYPSVNPLRYLPRLSQQTEPRDTAGQVLTRARDFFRIEDQPVYLFFARLSPVIKLPISSIIKFTNTELLLNVEDICITPMNFDWLIFRSLEDEWQFGYREKKPAAVIG